MTPTDLDAIEAQLDSTVPYYLPALIKELRALRGECDRLTEENKGLRQDVVPLLRVFEPPVSSRIPPVKEVLAKVASLSTRLREAEQQREEWKAACERGAREAKRVIERTAADGVEAIDIIGNAAQAECSRLRADLTATQATLAQVREALKAASKRAHIAEQESRHRGEFHDVKWANCGDPDCTADRAALTLPAPPR